MQLQTWLTSTISTTRLLGLSKKQNTYIGRKNALLPGSIWGNPFKLINKDPISRFKCILDFYVHVTHSDLFFEIYQLCDTTMGCWCNPQICHGDVLIFLINNSIINCNDAISHHSSWNRNVHSQVQSSLFKFYLLTNLSIIVRSSMSIFDCNVILLCWMTSLLLV